MNLIAKRIRGMQDILPEESIKWEYVEKILRDKAKVYGFKNIRTPVLEHTNLFERSSGDTSDIVEKEMYSFQDRGGREVSLRPEGTAGIVRAVFENGLHNQTLPLKLMYMSSCYRYDKPQSGRLREFFQFGLEVFGGRSALTDAEIVSIADASFKQLGIRDVELEINAIGCEECRPKYKSALIKYFSDYKDKLCNVCQDRLIRNPMRIFDCKNEGCKEICKQAPLMIGYLCKSCALHFEHFGEFLKELDIKYRVNPYIVRGLDYYTKTVFEFVIDRASGPLEICGGGRYDNLSKVLGGPTIYSVGLGIGMERLLMVMDEQGLGYGKKNDINVYIVTMGEEGKKKSISVAERLRKIGLTVQQDLIGRNVKSQVKYADKEKYEYCIFIGKDEIENNIVKLKKMSDGTEDAISIDENLESYFLKIMDETKKS